MNNNITRADLDALIAYLGQDSPMLTQSRQVRLFEQEWSDWLGVKHSVFVNSGSSANLLTMAALRERFGAGEIIVPSLTWVSDIASVMRFRKRSTRVTLTWATVGRSIASMGLRVARSMARSMPRSRGATNRMASP